MRAPSPERADTVHVEQRRATLAPLGRAGPFGAARKRVMQTRPAVDSPRAWVVVAACFWINLFSLAMVRSGAIVYVGVAQTFMVSREEASWPLCLATLFNLAVGPVSGVLAQHFEISRLLTAGCLLMSLSVSACFFASDIYFLIVCLGVLHGIGLSILTLVFTAVIRSVARYKALALGIINMGFVLGGLIFPPIVQWLLDEYGIRGSLLLAGALMLNSTAAAFLTKAPQPAAVRRGSGCPAETSAVLLDGPAERQRPDTSSALSEKRKSFSEPSESACLYLHEGTEENATPLERKGHTAISTWKKLSRLCDVSPSDSRRRGTWAMCLTFLRRPQFYITAYTIGQLWFLATTLLTVVVDFAVELGLPKWHAVSLVTFMTAADLLTRLVSGLVTDNGLVSKSTLISLHLFAYAAACACMVHFQSYAALAASASVSGWCSGALVTFTCVILAELVDPEAFGLCMGVANFIAAFALLERPLVIGYFRDKLGSYDGLFYTMAAVSASCGVVWLMVRLKEKCIDKRRLNKDELLAKKRPQNAR